MTICALSRTIETTADRFLISLRDVCIISYNFQNFKCELSLFSDLVALHKNGVSILFQYDRFEALRVNRGVTKTFIAHTLGRSPTLCQDWKQQKSQPNDQQLREVARILGTTPAYLRGETDDPDPSPAPDAEMEALLTSLREREDMRMLFKLAQDASPEDVRQAVKIIEALRRHD